MKTLAAVAALLLLAGCGSGSSTSAPPSDTPHPDATKPAGDTTGPGVYAGKTSGGLRLTAEIPVPSTDPRVAKVERFRKDAGAPAFTYVIVKYDNTRGTEQSEVLGGAYVITLNGKTIHVLHAASPDGVFEKFILDHLPKAENDTAWRYYSTFYDSQLVRPGAKETAILATPKRIASVGGATVTVDDSGSEAFLTKRP